MKVKVISGDGTGRDTQILLEDGTNIADKIALNSATIQIQAGHFNVVKLQLHCPRAVVVGDWQPVETVLDVVPYMTDEEKQELRDALADPDPIDANTPKQLRQKIRAANSANKELGEAIERIAKHLGFEGTATALADMVTGSEWFRTEGAGESELRQLLGNARTTLLAVLDSNASDLEKFIVTDARKRVDEIEEFQKGGK